MTVDPGQINADAHVDLDAVAGCPAADHVQWVIEQLVPGAPACDPDELLLHCDLSPDRAAEVSARLHRCASGAPAIVTVDRWETRDDGKVVVHYRAAGGNAAQLILGAPGVDGRLGAPRVQRLSESMDGVAVDAIATRELTTADQAEVHRVFAAAYRDPDHAYVDAQLDRLDYVALARREGEAIAFFIGGRRWLDLPVLGPTRVNLAGLACTDPAVRRGGVMLSTSAAVMAALEPPASQLGASRLATPATLRSMISLLSMAAWPSADDPLTLYRETTATQRSVGATLAAAHGAADFDEEHFVCIGHGRSIGTPVVEIDAGPEHGRRSSTFTATEATPCYGSAGSRRRPRAGTHERKSRRASQTPAASTTAASEPDVDVDATRGSLARARRHARRGATMNAAVEGGTEA